MHGRLMKKLVEGSETREGGRQPPEKRVSLLSVFMREPGTLSMTASAIAAEVRSPAGRLAALSLAAPSLRRVRTVTDLHDQLATPLIDKRE